MALQNNKQPFDGIGPRRPIKTTSKASPSSSTEARLEYRMPQQEAANASLPDKQDNSKDNWFSYSLQKTKGKVKDYVFQTARAFYL